MKAHFTAPWAPLTALACSFNLLLMGCSAGTADDETGRVDPSPASSSSPIPTTAATVACPPTPLEVAIDYELELAGDGGVVVHVQSNLPDSAELMVSMFSEPQSYLGQDTRPLREGSADFGPFTDEGAPLRGAYDLSITLPIARNQPDQVQACIGRQGKLMTGPLVSEHDITGDNLASVEQRVVIED